MLSIALIAWALVIVYMACALSYRQIERACARRRITARLDRLGIGQRIAIDNRAASQINIDARAECADGCGCDDWQAHADHIRQDAETMRLYREG